MTEIIKARVTFVFHGYGDLIVTDSFVSWNKSASSFLAFGVLNAITDNNLSVALGNILCVEKYPYVTGGLVLKTKVGAEYKFGFKHKRDFNTAYEFLRKAIKKEV